MRAVALLPGCARRTAEGGCPHIIKINFKKNNFKKNNFKIDFVWINDL
jgi:hypothetical protein